VRVDRLGRRCARYTLEIFRVASRGVRISEKAGDEGIVREISILHVRRRNRAYEGNAVPLPLTLVVGEKESLVLSNGPTQSSAELVEIELLPAGGKKAARVQLGIAEELEHRAVEVVSARLGGYQHRWTRARAIFRGIVEGQNLEFLDGVNGGQNGDATGGQLIVVVAVKQPIGG
jgi:hypothetical protein